jgi:hypothetical protein
VAHPDGVGNVTQFDRAKATRHKERFGRIKNLFARFVLYQFVHLSTDL